MATYYWQPTDGILASEEHNWNPNGVPGAGDNIYFEDDYSASDCTLDIAEVVLFYLGLGAQNYSGTVTTANAFECHGFYTNNCEPDGLFVQNHTFTVTWFKHAHGTWQMNADVIIRDLAASDFGAHGIFELDDLIFTNNGVYGTPRVIRSSNVLPTYPIRLRINAAVNDLRQFDFDFLEIRNLCPYIGDGTTEMFFNTGDVTNDGVLDPPAPIRRDQKFDEHYCEGRSYGRVYPEGGSAGVIDLTGLIPWAGFKWQQMIAMRDARTQIAYIGQYCTMPRAFVESLRFGQKDGPYLPFSMTLVEDR